MIKVEITYEGKGLKSLLIKGHANSGEYGKDIVCAGVSAVSVGALNALEDVDDYEIEVEEGRIKATFGKALSDHDEIVLETMILQLKTIQVSYPEAIDIKERK